MKTNFIVAVSALGLLALTGCESNNRNRNSTTTGRDASMNNTATSTGAGGNRGYYVPEHRMHNTRATTTTRPASDTPATARPRNTVEPGMGMVDEKAKGGRCGAVPCDEAKQN